MDNVDASATSHTEDSVYRPYRAFTDHIKELHTEHEREVKELEGKIKMLESRLWGFEYHEKTRQRENQLIARLNEKYGYRHNKAVQTDNSYLPYRILSASSSAGTSTKKRKRCESTT